MSLCNLSQEKLPSIIPNPLKRGLNLKQFKLKSYILHSWTNYLFAYEIDQI